MMFTPRSKINENVWDEGPGSKENPLWLLTPAELPMVPDQTPLHCVNGSIAIKGTDAIDTDTRKGYLAYGILESQLTNNEGK